MNNLIPLPVSVKPSDGVFTLSAATQIRVEPGRAEIATIGQYLADRLSPATGYTLPIVTASGAPAAGHILLTTAQGDSTLGEEGYELTVSPQDVTLAAYQPAGLFRAVQTLRQLLPPAIESTAQQAGPWTIPAGVIRDYPRFSWRGFMLDVARHFFPVQSVKRCLDLMAYYKLNRLHLHLTDDQGWRIAINLWPSLAIHGGSTEVGGGPGGYYSQAEYADLVAYAQSRYVTLVPEFDLPGHTNAALAAYPPLNRDEVAPPLYTGTEVGFSSLSVDNDVTFVFMEDVIEELAALTPGPYIHIGGDEAAATPKADYIRFIEEVQAIVEAQGKTAIGWEEMAQAKLLSATVAQLWNGSQAAALASRGGKVILSPAGHTYLDMKYDADTPLGQSWAGHVSVRAAYDWAPEHVVEGLAESNILGIEAPLWTETIRTMADIEYMVFPRLPGLAEVGWSPAAGRGWDEYKYRLASHRPRLEALRVNYCPASEVPWP